MKLCRNFANIFERSFFSFARMSCSEQSTFHGQASARVWSFPNCSFKASRRKKLKRKTGETRETYYHLTQIELFFVKTIRDCFRLSVFGITFFLFSPRRFERAIRKRTKHGQVLGREQCFARNTTPSQRKRSCAAK